jgi:DMSO/TMAO reductase YedYZ heme-binding membrane subunit
MSLDLKAVLKSKAINEWRLFWLVSAPMSVLMVVAVLGTDMSTPSGVSHMISFSVRWAVPFIFLVVAASALHTLFPGPFPAWLLRNRKYVGMCFAVAMAWQGAFIFIMSNFFRDYYFEEIFFLRDELEGSTGYIFLTAMVVTSFKFGRKHLTPKQWKLLHRSGIYFLWAYPFSVYWWNLSYYENPVPIDYVFYWSGFLAFALRIAAWGKKRQQAAIKNSPESRTPIALRIMGGAVVAFGLVAAATGLRWQEPVTAFLTAPVWSAELELWLPYWPFEPFLSIFIIGLGTLLATHVSQSAD